MTQNREVELSEKEILMLIAAIRMSGLNHYHDNPTGESRPNKFQRKMNKIMNKLESALSDD